MPASLVSEGPFSATPDGNSRLREVLVVNSYHEGYVWTDDIVKGVRTALSAASLRIDLDLEYLDSRRHGDTAHADTFRSYLQHKFAEKPPDVVIATDDPAVRLLVAHHADLFPQVPVIFCGVNEFHGTSRYVSAHPQERPWMAGVLETVDVDSTVDLMLRLHPGTGEIVTVGEDDDSSYVSAISASHPGLKVREIPAQHIALAETGKRLQEIRPGALVLFSPFSRDGRGQVLSIADSARFVAGHTNVPIYSVSKPSLGLGVVGGEMTDSFAQGQAAGSMALSVLQGTRPALLGIQSQGVNPYEFDYKQLRRWHLREALLPPGSIIINRPKSFYAVHPFMVWTVVCFLALQFGVILILLVQQKRRRTAEAALRAHSQQLAQSNYMLEQFAYITAHDFQEPIRTVALFSELLSRNLDGQLDEQGRQSIDFVLAHSRRLHSMVRALLSWVRAVDTPADSAPSCDSSAIMEQILEEHRQLIEELPAQVVTGALPPIAVHPQHMRELLSQLVQNAIQHGGGGGLKISVTADRIADAWKFSVYNSGTKIPQESQTRIFGVFRKLHGSQDGIGMGLAICRRIIDYYGGRIWVDSAIGEGCTFFFTVPDTARPRPRRPHWFRLQTIMYQSTHAHSDR